MPKQANLTKLTSGRYYILKQKSQTTSTASGAINSSLNSVCKSILLLCFGLDYTISLIIEYLVH